MRPGPSTRMSRGCFGSDAGAGRTRLAVTDMQCFQRHSARRRRQSSAPSLMTANVDTEAKVPCIPQSESFGASRGTRRPRPTDARREVNSCLVAPNYPSLGNDDARRAGQWPALELLPFGRHEPLFRRPLRRAREMRNPREHTRAKNVLSLWNPRRRRKRRCSLAFRLFRRGGSFTSR